MTAATAKNRRCWSCLLNNCPAGWHSWADIDDIEASIAASLPNPADERCSCVCVDIDDLDEEPDMDAVSLDAEPCPLCGAAGACSYDTEGRPMIHTLNDDDGTPE